MKNKKIVIIVILIMLILVSITTLLIYNLFFKEEIINLKLQTDVYSQKTLMDFSNEINCTIQDNQEINTNKVGTTQNILHCRDDENKRIKYIIDFNIVDEVAPKIILKDSYTVTEGYNKSLTDVIISVDNYDNMPKREIIGEYDFNTVGNYPLTYKITDSSGNTTTQDFMLYVIEKKANTSNSNDSYISFNEVKSEHKNSNTEIGIDVSKWQEEIDFEKVKKAGAEFVIIRIGHQDGFNGEYILDPYFKQNIENATKNNLKVGIYFYSYANSKEEAINQVNWITNNLKNYQIDLPIVYDWESWSNFNSTNLSLYQFNEVADTFLEEIEKKGYTPMLYSSKNYLENIWYESNYDVWLAHYTNKTNYNGNYYIWQMCSDGKIDGINGYVDIDILYKK